MHMQVSLEGNHLGYQADPSTVLQQELSLNPGGLDIPASLHNTEVCAHNACADRAWLAREGGCNINYPVAQQLVNSWVNFHSVFTVYNDVYGQNTGT